MAQRKFLIDGGFSVNADSEITGNLDMTGHILPTIDSDGTTGYDLGSPTMKWRDLYLSQGSLYIDGQKVLQSDAGTIVVQADPDQSLLTKTTGAGVLTFASPNPIAIAATLQMGAGKKITTADANAVVFGDKVDMDQNQIINIALPTADGHAASKKYVDDKFDDVLGGAPAALDTLNELANALGDDANFAGSVTTALATKATITYVDAEIATAISSANTNTTNVTGALDTRVTTLESTTATNSSNITTLQGSVASNATDIAANSQAVVDAIATAAADATTKANAAQATATAYTDTRETAITSAYTSAIATAVAAKDEISELADVSIGTLSNNQVLRYNSTSGLWVNVTLSSDNLLEGGTNLFYTDTRVGDYLTGNGYATETYADAAEAAAVVTAGEYTDSEIATATTSLQAYADTAQADAEATAAAYTDARETAITAAYQTYADTAETDAKAYTDARETAIITAYQAYADQAEADAESAAAVDATNKANAAETAAVSTAAAYTDAEVSAEASARSTADTALDNAKVDKTSAQALHPSDALSIGGNIITLRKGDGTTETVDISPYLDDTNLARIVAGTMNSSGIATFTRDDSSTFTVDMSVLLDDTNLARIVSASFNTSNGVLTLTRNDSSTVTVDLDSRFTQASQFSNVHGNPVVISSAQSTANDSGTTDINLGQSGLYHYNVYINRMIMRPTEFTYNSSTGVVTFATGTLTTNDEVEITGLRIS